MLQHLEHHIHDDIHSAAFCCLYCAARHHTTAGLEEHAKVHSTEMNVMKSTEVCVGTHDVKSPPEDHHLDSIRRHGHLISQDPESGATLPVYRGRALGDIRSSSALKDVKILMLIRSVYRSQPGDAGLLLLSNACGCPNDHPASNDESYSSVHLRKFVVQASLQTSADLDGQVLSL